MFLSAEFEAAIMARRVDIQALCAEARRLENEGEDVWDLGIIIPAGWLPALVEGVEDVIYHWVSKEADESVGEASSEDSEELERISEKLERMLSLASEIREVESGCAYTVSAYYGEALFRGIAGALFIQEHELRKMPKYVDPPILRFVATEQGEALARVYSAINKLDDEAEEG
jgi:hypothetical protein